MRNLFSFQSVVINLLYYTSTKVQKATISYRVILYLFDSSFHSLLFKAWFRNTYLDFEKNNNCFVVNVFMTWQLKIINECLNLCYETF